MADEEYYSEEEAPDVYPHVGVSFATMHMASSAEEAVNAPVVPCIMLHFPLGLKEGVTLDQYGSARPEDLKYHDVALPLPAAKALALDLRQAMEAGLAVLSGEIMPPEHPLPGGTEISVGIYVRRNLDRTVSLLMLEEERVLLPGDWQRAVDNVGP